MSLSIIVYFLDNSVRLIVSITLEFIACYWEFILIRRWDTRRCATILLLPSSKKELKESSNVCQYLQHLFKKPQILIDSNCMGLHSLIKRPSFEDS